MLGSFSVITWRLITYRNMSRILVSAYILALLILYIQILFIPHFLGYVLINRADGMYVPGEVYTIMNYGKFYQKYDKYPMVSILYSIIFEITNTKDYRRYIMLIPPLFSLLFIFSLTKIFNMFEQLRDKEDKNKNMKTFGFLFSFVYYAGFYHDSVHPAFYAFTLSVLLVYLTLSRKFVKSIPGKVLTFIILISLPFSHPYYVTAGLMFLAALAIYAKIDKRYKEYSNTYLLYLSITLIIFVTWIFKNIAAYNALNQILKGIENAYIQPAFTEGVHQAIHLTFYEIIIYVLGYLGRYSIPGLIAISGVTYLIIRRSLRRILILNVHRMYVISVLIVIQLLMMFIPIFSHYPERYLNLSYFSVAFPALALLIYPNVDFSQVIEHKKIIASILILAFILSFFSLYEYPDMAFNPNSGITYNEIVSAEFIFKYRATMIPIFSPYDQLASRYCSFVDLATAQKCNGINRRYFYLKIFPAHHFGYTKYGKFTLLVNIKNSYILLTDYALQSYSNIPPYKRANRLSLVDYHRINSDHSIYKIYDGSNVRIYLTSLQVPKLK